MNVGTHTASYCILTEYSRSPLSAPPVSPLLSAKLQSCAFPRPDIFCIVSYLRSTFRVIILSNNYRLLLSVGSFIVLK